MPARFQVKIRSPELPRDLVLANGIDFNLGDTELDSFFQVSLPKRERDLLRIMMGIYIADRLVRRPRPSNDIPGSREIELEVDVAYPDFWSDDRSLELVHSITAHLSNDFWSFRFRLGHRVPEQLTLLPEVQIVCQYSGGLDSAAGLCRRLRSDPVPVMTVTAAHQSFHGRLRAQLNCIRQRYDSKGRSVFCRARLAHPPRLSAQETTQRLRAGLFMRFGGAVASAVGAEAVEVFENGIGAINIPPQIGMMLGSNATRGCHPAFLLAMERLVSHVARRTIRFNLPMLRATKAEAVRSMVEDELGHVIDLTASCVHWPLRNSGNAKQCGTCFGCIGRRQAVMAAGAMESAGAYEVDLFGPHPNELYTGDTLDPLKASLMQVVDLRRLCETGALPRGFTQHLLAAGVASRGMNDQGVVDLHRRYVAEWQPIIARAKDQGLPWGSWIKKVGIAA